MTLWNEFTSDEKTLIENTMIAACTAASGVTLTDAQSTAFASLIDGYISVYAAGGVRCLWDPEDPAADGIVSAGAPIIPSIVAILRNFTDTTFKPSYGRKTSTGTTNKSGTESVSLKPSASATLPERIEVAVPDIRAASVGESETSDVDAAEKFRFDAETEKSLGLLLGRWIRRASFSHDL